MRKLHYYLVDVFTNQPFGGNQLAVFTNGRGVPPALMQKIARELNFSETTFVLPPQDQANDFWVRIFTPAVEMPTAGHPTIGTSFVLAREQFIDTTGSEATLRLEEGVGVITVQVQLEQGLPGLIKMSQPLPQFGVEFTNQAGLAQVLSLEEEALMAGRPAQVVSCGVPFLFVPLKNLAAMRQAKLRLDLWEQHLQHFATPHLFLFTLETELKNSSVHCRMFAPALGIAEDPATGIASGPLGSYLVQHKLVPVQTKTHLLSEQGFEMGRPSLIHIEIEQTAGQISAVTVGGECVVIGEGYIEVPETGSKVAGTE
jgi:trans-2,3-dihydro-3-hydroxyanthranilate isomerase